MGECLEILGALKKEHSYKNIFKILCGHGEKTAAQYIKDGNECALSYTEYEKLTYTVAGNIKNSLTETSGFIGLRWENNPKWPAVFWGILAAGFNPLLLNSESDAVPLNNLIGECGAIGLIAVGNINCNVPTIDPETLFAEDESYTGGEFGNMVAMCTSGTTGDSKVFVYDGKAMSAQMSSITKLIDKNEDLIYDSSEGPCKNLAMLPFHHVFGFVAVYMWYSFFAKTIVYLEDKNPSTIMNTCRTLGVTHIFSVPLFWNKVVQGIVRKAAQGGAKREKMFERMLNLSYTIQNNMKRNGRKIVSGSIFKGVQENLVGSSVRFMISGGGHILPETIRIINSIGYPLYNGFGMTETGVTSVERSYDISKRVESGVGIPFDSIKYKIAGGKDVGELYISGDSLHSGRMVDGKYVARNTKKDKWFATGDIARTDGERLFIEGRIKEVIINDSGENIYPDEMEDYFTSLPGVSQLCILGLKTDDPYEQITMVLQPLDDDCDVKELSSLLTEINSALPMYKKLRRVIISKAQLPVANGIKVQRAKLKQLIEQGEWAYDEFDFESGEIIAESEELNPVYSDALYNEIKAHVRTVFAQVLLLDEGEVKDDAHFVFDLGGDSLSVIGVMAQLEENYDLEIPDTEFAGAVNVNEVATIIYDKIKK